MNKKLSIIMAPLMAITFLASCGGGGGDDPGPEPGPSSETPMYFKCLSDTASLFVTEKLDVSFSLEYSNDAKTWKTVEFKEMGGKVCIFSLKKDETIYFRGDNTLGFNGDLGFSVKEKDGDLSVNGYIMSLIQKTDFSTMTAMPKNCFKNFFSGNDNLVDASNLILPLTVNDECFSNMFRMCEYLTSAPELPATSLSDSCYFQMFNYCTSLVIAPKLSATKLAPSCCYNMFNYCSALKIPPDLSNVTSVETNCYCGMFARTALTINTTDGTKFFKCPDEPEKYAENMFPDNDERGDWTPEANTTYYYTLD